MLDRVLLAANLPEEQILVANRTYAQEGPLHRRVASTLMPSGTTPNDPPAPASRRPSATPGVVQTSSVITWHGCLISPALQWSGRK